MYQKKLPTFKKFNNIFNLGKDGWLLQLQPAAWRRHHEAVLAVGAGARQVADTEAPQLKRRV
jgi:hypothetical protein